MKSSHYPFNERGITGQEQYIQDGLESIRKCSELYEGDAINLCLRDILINFYATGWSQGFRQGQQPTHEEPNV